MKNGILKSFGLFFIFAAVFLSSCSNVFEENESKDSENAENIPVVSGCVTVYGSVTPFNEAVPSDSIENDSGARAAGVNFQVLPYAYYVYGVKSSGEKVDGNVETDGTEKKYTISLPYGTWTIYVGAKVDDAKVLEDSFSCTLTEDANKLNHTFTLKPKQTESGKGKVNLLITTPSSVKKVIVNPSSSGFNASLSDQTVTITSTNNEMKSGNYTVQIDFYDSTDTNAKLLYSTIQGISIYDGYTTNYWVSNEGNSFISNGSFTITDQMISDFALLTYYVDGTNSTGTGSGTWVKPFAKVSEALGKISDTTKNYTIYVNGEITEDSTLAIGIRKVTIKSKDVSSPATIKRGSNTNTMISLDSAGTLTLNGIIIDGDPDGNSGTITESGAGIFSSGTLTLKNVTVKNCKTKKNNVNPLSPSYANGGGLCVNNGSAEIEGGSFEYCTADQGGGIFNNGSLSVTNCTISDCSVTENKDGGGIYNNAGHTINLKGTSSIESCTASGGSGGGIYNNGNCYLYNSAKITSCNGKFGAGVQNSRSGNFTMYNSSSILSCSSTAFGGGVYNLGAFTMNGSSGISRCSTTSGSGGGVYTNDGNFTMNDTSGISSCSAAMYGGGICNFATLNFLGGTISGNTGTGKGIYQGGTMNMSGSATVSNTDNIYLASGKVVNIAADLSATSVATIECADYADKQVILKYNDKDYSDSTASAKIKSMFNKFSLTHTTYALKKDGRLWAKNRSASDSSTLKESVEILSSGDESTITLASDITFTDGTYDGNDMDHGLQIPAGAKLTLTSDSQKTLSINSTGSNNFIYKVIQVSGELELTNIKLTSTSDIGNAAIELNNTSARLIMNSGSLIDGFNPSTRSTGSTIRVTQGTFIMNGGTISNNKGRHDFSSAQTGGVYIGAKGTFIMKGGTITVNSTTYPTYDAAKGGGVYAKSGGTFIFAGGTISGNIAKSGNKYYCESGSYFGTSEENKTIQTSVLALNDE